MVKANKMLEQAAARREEAGSRRGLARLLSAGKLQHELERQAQALEVEAAALEKDAQPAGERKHRRARVLCGPSRS
jgi:hypothetical protein